MVKDEEDAIEAFVRHTLAVADHLVVFDHHSTDRTGYILHQLAREGLPLTVLTDDEFEYRQAARTTALVRLAVSVHRADWVLPLDADEFLQAESPAAFRRLLAARPPAAPPLRLSLVNYGPHPADDRGEANPVRRLRHRLRRVDTGKVAIPRRLAAAPGFAVSTGNHDVCVNEVVQPFDVAGGCHLAHFPIRSGWQAALKVVQHETQRAAGGYGGGGTHYGLHYARLIHDPARFLAEPELYLCGEVAEPAAYWGAAVRHAATTEADPQRLTRGLLGLVRRLADSHERWRSQAERTVHRSALRRTLSRLWRWLGLPARGNRFAFRPAAEPDSRTPEQLRGDVRVLKSEVADGVLSAVVRVSNTGAAKWRTSTGDGQVNIGAQAMTPDGRVSVTDWHRAGLPADLSPGDAVDIPLTCPLPADPGTALGIDLVAEGVTWFGCRVPAVTPPEVPSTS
jgi:hypothetical protein